MRERIGPGGGCRESQPCEVSGPGRAESPMVAPGAAIEDSFDEKDQENRIQN